MASLAELPTLVGFFSYSRTDDEDSGGRLSKLRERIQAELRGQLGRTKTDFRLWQDKYSIAHGELWKNKIRSAVAESVFFIPIITPTAVRSEHCKFEFDSFLAREKELGRDNLIFPILYIPVPALVDDRWREDPLLSIVRDRQYEDLQNLRHLDASSSEAVALRVITFCANIARALEQEWLSPEKRARAEAEQRAEEERRREEAERQRRLERRELLELAEAQQRAKEERRPQAINQLQQVETKLSSNQAVAENGRRQDGQGREAQTKAQLSVKMDKAGLVYLFVLAMAGLIIGIIALAAQ